MNKETAQRLFNYMQDEHGVTLLDTDMQEIEWIISEGKKARKHNSPKLQEILDEVTPSEMEEKKAEMQGKPLKGWVKVYKDNIDGALLLGPVYPTKNHFSIFLNGITKPIACIDLSKHYEGEGL